MRYPTLNDTGASREFTDVFGGLDVDNGYARSGWYGNSKKRTSRWAWSQNATCDKYPAAATRAHRRYNVSHGSPRGFTIIKDKTDAVKTVEINPEGGHYYVFVNGVKMGSNLSPEFGVQAYDKHIVSLGKKIYILRSNSADTDKAVEIDDGFNIAHVDLDAKFETTPSQDEQASAEIRYYACNIDGDDMLVWYQPAPPSTSTTIPAGASGIYWVDTSGDVEQLKKYSTSLQDWIPVSKAYIRIEFQDVTADAFGNFNEGDAVTISGAVAGANSGTVGSDVAAYNQRVINALNTVAQSARIIVKKGGGDGEVKSYIIVEVAEVPASNARGYIAQPPTDKLTIKRGVPVLEYVCAGENRIWGCDSETNEIRCCKLGDPANWYLYSGISTDSYAVTVGGEAGKFTGAAFAFGNPIFFKENAVIRIYGTAPSNYRLTSITAPGAAAGSGKSVAVVNDLVFYLSKNGVCCYDGSTVREIGDPLGGGKYKNGVGAGADGKYYLSCEDESGAWHLFVYDLKRSAWMREDSLKALYGASIGNSVTFIEQIGATKATCRLVSNRVDAPIVTDSSGVNDTTPQYTTEGSFDWELRTPIIGYESPDHKYISRFTARVNMQPGARLDVSVRYDNDDAWEKKSSITSFGRGSFNIPIRPKRCDHMQIRFSGHGDCVLYSVAKLYENGSDVVR